MCETCGCDDAASVRIIDLDRLHAPASHGAPASHDSASHSAAGHSHGAPHTHTFPAVIQAGGADERAEAGVGSGGRVRTITLAERVLAKNDDLADRNRRFLAERGIVALNLMSSPGSGKTTLLERTIVDLGERVSISVIEGDQETVFDAERIRATGCRVVQINTGAGCHLDAAMIDDGLRALAPPRDSLVVIENVGNLVCPALFDLGEARRVVVMSVTEGADKPLKYPHMFRTADLVVLNKIDLLPYVDFDVVRCRAAARHVNPGLEFLEVSATKGDGLDDWYDWVRTAR